VTISFIGGGSQMYPEKTTDLSMTSFITYVVSSTPNVLKNLTTSKMLIKIGSQALWNLMDVALLLLVARRPPK
jgi:hypothetical protein